jgi:trigger factor
MPGFRPGKAPPELVRKNFEGTAREEAVERVLRKTVPRALEEEKLSPVAAPVVEKLEHEPGRPLRFELKVECAPDFEPKNYKGLALEKKTKVFSEADVDARLKELREANAKLAASEAAEAGDAHFLVVDYAGTVEGKPLEGAEAKGQLIDMAAPQRLAGFSEGLKGAKAGETRDVSVSLPEDYPNKDLAGKPAVFHVTVQEIKEKRLPALDDEFAKDLNFENLQALRDAVRKSMEAEFERDQRRALEKQTADALLEANAFDVPPSQVEEHARYLTSQLERFLRERGAGDALP